MKVFLKMTQNWVIFLSLKSFSGHSCAVFESNIAFLFFLRLFRGFFELARFLLIIFAQKKKI